MDLEVNRDERMHQIADRLHQNRNVGDKKTAQEKWGNIASYSRQECPKKEANKFLLCCLIDYRFNSDQAWKNGYRYINSLEDQDEIWAKIASIPKEVWESEVKFKECGLHWMHKAHNRLWQIAKNICFYYDGDARRIWQGSNSFDVLCRLYYIGAGGQISRMIVGALKDCGQISGKCDVKADVHICRVLGRVVSGKDANPEYAIELGRQLDPSDPWQLDWPLWYIGNSYCHITKPPECSKCDLAKNCLYAHEHSS